MSAAAEQPPIPSPRSRRAILAGALGGIGAWAVAAVGARSRVAAANGDPIVIGQSNVGTATTVLENTDNTNGVLYVISANGTGLYAYSPQGYGTYGQTDSGAGVRAEALEGGIGVNASSSTGVAVQAQTFSSSGVALHGIANGGLALRTEGRIRADNVSGVATIRAGSTSKTISPGVDVTSASFVLLTPKTNIGSRALWFTTNATANTFTINMSASRSSSTKVAWLLLG